MWCDVDISKSFFWNLLTVIDAHLHNASACIFSHLRIMWISMSFCWCYFFSFIPQSRLKFHQTKHYSNDVYVGVWMCVCARVCVYVYRGVYFERCASKIDPFFENATLRYSTTSFVANSKIHAQKQQQQKVVQLIERELLIKSLINPPFW